MDRAAACHGSSFWALMEDEEVRRAQELMRRAYRHAGQPERCARHSLQVGALLAEIGCRREVVVAGILHDVVEDTCARESDVRAQFGGAVADLVLALTEDPAIEDYAARKRALRQAVLADGRSAMVIFAADKVARLRAADDEGVEIEPRKLEHYERSLELLIAHGIRTRHVQELASRLDARRGRVVPEHPGAEPVE